MIVPERPARPRAPQLDGAALDPFELPVQEPITGGQFQTVGTKSQGGNATDVPRENGAQLSAGQVPELDGAVLHADGRRPIVGRDRHGVDRLAHLEARVRDVLVGWQRSLQSRLATLRMDTP